MPRKAKDLPRMPEEFRQQAEAAILVHRKRGWVPDIVQGKDYWGCPYAKEDAGLWDALLFEIFGTRQSAIVDAFFGQLSEFGTSVWKRRHPDGRGQWQVEESVMRQMLAIMLALKPQDEAQAAYAAQLVALHLSAMKLAGWNAMHSGGDTRTAAILNKTVNAYGMGMERMARLQGKAQSRSIHQTIEVHHHDNRQQAVVFNGGVGPNGGQAHGTDGGETIQRAALPCPQSGGESLSGSSREGKASVPGPWWGKRLWRALRDA